MSVKTHVPGPPGPPCGQPGCQGPAVTGKQTKSGDRVAPESHPEAAFLHETQEDARRSQLPLRRISLVLADNKAVVTQLRVSVGSWIPEICCQW